MKRIAGFLMMAALGLFGQGGQYASDAPPQSLITPAVDAIALVQLQEPTSAPAPAFQPTDPDLRSLNDIGVAIEKRNNDDLGASYDGHGPSCATISCVCPLGDKRYLVKESWSEIGDDGCLDVFRVKGDEVTCLFGFASECYSEPDRFRTMKLPENLGEVQLCEVWVATRRGNYTYYLYSIGEMEAQELASVWVGGDGDDRYDAMYADIDHDGDTDILIYDRISGNLKTAFKWSTSLRQFEQTK